MKDIDMTFLKGGVLLSVILAILIPNTLQASAQLQQQPISPQLQQQPHHISTTRRAARTTKWI